MNSLRLKVGALITVSLALLVGFIILLGNFSVRGGSRIKVDFDFSGNLQSGAAVKISGIKVGKVEEVAFMGGELDKAGRELKNIQGMIAGQRRVVELVQSLSAAQSRLRQHPDICALIGELDGLVLGEKTTSSLLSAPCN